MIVAKVRYNKASDIMLITVPKKSGLEVGDTVELTKLTGKDE